MAMNTTDYISVWFDSTSDDHAWIVDRCDNYGYSDTVKIYAFVTKEDEDEYANEYNAAEKQARSFARKYAKRTGLEIR